jgi:hypothetical protein
LITFPASPGFNDRQKREANWKLFVLTRAGEIPLDARYSPDRQ